MSLAAFDGGLCEALPVQSLLHNRGVRRALCRNWAFSVSASSACLALTRQLVRWRLATAPRFTCSWRALGIALLRPAPKFVAWSIPFTRAAAASTA